MVGWSFVLAGPTGQAIRDLAVAGTFRFELDGDWTFKAPLLYADPAAASFYDALTAGTPQLRGYRQNDGTNTPLKFSGGLAPFDEHASAEEAQINLVFQAPPGYPLNNRIVDFYETNDGTSVADGGSLIDVDAGQIFKALIDATEADHPTGIRVGTVATTTTRQKSYTLKNIWDAGKEMSGQQVDNGYDLDITPLDPSQEPDGAMAEVSIVAQLGVDRSASVQFQYGPGTLANCLDVQRQWTNPVNRVTTEVTKAAAFPGDPDAGKKVAATVEDTASIALYGLFAHAEETPDAIDNADLTDRATRLLQPNPVRSVTFTPDPAAPNCPQPWLDYWLGDTVGFYANADGLLIDTTERVVAIEIDIDENGNETAHRLEYGKPSVTLGRLLGKLNARVYWLERNT